MLEIADSLDMALESSKKADKDSGAEASLRSLTEGISMTEKNIQKVFQKFGVKKYGAIGDPFDPSLHNALFQLPTEGAGEKDATSVGLVLKPGYKLNDRVIRAADVGTITSSGNNNK